MPETPTPTELLVAAIRPTPAPTRDASRKGETVVGRWIDAGEVCRDMSISRKTLMRRLEEDRQFPKPVDRRRGASAKFVRAEIERYMEQKERVR